LTIGSFIKHIFIQKTESKNEIVRKNTINNETLMIPKHQSYQI